MRIAIMLTVLLTAHAHAATVTVAMIRVALPSGFAPVALEETKDVPVPSAAQVPVGVDAGVVPKGLWNSLAPTDAGSLGWLSQRIPGLDTSMIRTLTPEAADAMLADCAARGLTPLEFFTDAGFRGRGLFYFPRALLVGMYSRYDFRVVTPVSGKDEKGVPFMMQGMVVGAGTLDILYDRDDITFLHRDFDNNKYSVKVHVVERILGPGDLGVSGVVAHVGPFGAQIQRIVKVSPTEGRVETNLGSRVKPATRVSRRDVPL